MRQLAFVAALACATLGLATSAQGRNLGECEKKVPPEAERAFQDVERAVRAADAAAVTATMPSGRDARVHLALPGVDAGSYSRDQATEVLRTRYFATRKVLALTPAEGCTVGSETQLSRTYRLTVQIGRDSVDRTLTIDIVRRRVGQRDVWYLGALKDA
ncbi:MAG: hypothetical protein IT460_17750 [Planctomycetes bacterium]|nr:hypothetical protein [Planctomycetota bacterium]